MGVGGAVCRLEELGERKRGAQTPTAGALLIRDGESGSERFLGGCGIGPIALEQDFAAQAMGKGEIAAIFDSICVGQRFVDVRQCDVRAQRLRFELCEQHVVEPCIADAATTTIGRNRQRPSKVFRSRRGVMETTARPPQIQFAPDAPRRSRAPYREPPGPRPHSTRRRRRRAGVRGGTAR